MSAPAISFTPLSDVATNVVIVHMIGDLDAAAIEALDAQCIALGDCTVVVDVRGAAAIDAELIAALNVVARRIHARGIDIRIDAPNGTWRRALLPVIAVTKPALRELRQRARRSIVIAHSVRGRQGAGSILK